MRKIFLATCAVLFAGAAFAADLPPIVTKAPISYNPFITGSGWFVGAGTSLAVANSNVSGNVITLPGITGGNVSAAGGTVDVDVGYIWSKCLFGTWCQIETDAKYQNIVGNTAVGTISSRWQLTQEIDIGIDAIQALASVVPGINTTFPQFNPTGLLPSAVAVANTPMGYVGFKQAEMLISGNVGQSGGQDWAYAPGATSGFRWKTLGTNGSPNGGSIKVFGDILVANKGASIANLFGVGGAPIVTQANANLKTLVVVGVHYDFGL